MKTYKINVFHIDSKTVISLYVPSKVYEEFHNFVEVHFNKYSDDMKYGKIRWTDYKPNHELFETKFEEETYVINGFKENRIVLDLSQIRIATLFNDFQTINIHIR